MLEKEFIPYEQALELKELDFDELCFAWYISKKSGLEIGKVVKSNLIQDAVLAPTYSQAFRWFREKHNYHIYLQSFPDKFWNFVIEDISEKGYIRSDGSKRNMPRLITNSDLYKNYDDVQIACLKKLIEIIKYK